MPSTAATAETLVLRALIDTHRSALDALFEKYSATNPRLFGSVARGEAGPRSDIDIVVEMDPTEGNVLMRASGLMEETHLLLGREDVDVFPSQLLRKPVPASALAEVVAL